MRAAYFDTIAGISGDMTLGAFLSSGVSLDVLAAELKKLNLAGYELAASRIQRNGITAMKVEVIVSEQPKYHRHLSDINSIIEASTLSAGAKQRAQKIFLEIARAEAKVHDSTIEKVHFHEVGAIDSLVDIVGTAICMEQMRIDRVFSSPVKLGSGGMVNTQHGAMPVPTPATVEILKEYPVVLTDIPFELTTPTGAAIIKALSEGVLGYEHLNIESIGYGSGSRDLPGMPNLLRLLIGDLRPSYEHDEVVTIETNIDDMNTEILPYVVEKLLADGAHDAFLVPIIMKKGRPATLLSVLADRSKLDQMVDLIFRETTTLGVRIQQVERRKVPRTLRQVQTSLGVVHAKAVVIDGEERLVPEFEECKKIATEKKLPLKEVYRILENEFRK